MSKTTNEMNIDYYKSKTEEYLRFKKALARFLRAVPRTVMEEVLIESKILKRDYLTEEVSMK